MSTYKGIINLTAECDHCGQTMTEHKPNGKCPINPADVTVSEDEFMVTGINPKAMKRHKYLFTSDPGHGWLHVPRRELDVLNIADKVSHCSYQNGMTVYLEEDCDVQLYLDARKADGRPMDMDADVTFKNVERTPIRNYRPYVRD